MHLNLNYEELSTLVDALTAYRSVRLENKDWMIVPLNQRLSPVGMDELEKYLKAKLRKTTEVCYDNAEPYT